MSPQRRISLAICPVFSAVFAGLAVAFPGFAAPPAALLGLVCLVGILLFVRGQPIRRSSEVAPADAPTDQSNDNDRFRDFATLAADWLWETDAEGRILHVFGELRGMKDQDSERFIGCPLSALMTVPVDGGATRPLELESRRPLRGMICRYEALDGPRFCRISGHSITNDDGAFQGYRGTAADVTDQVQQQQAEKSLAFFDPLTGLANGRLVEDRLEQALNARALTRGDVAVIWLDLDGFKSLNDGFGHDLGDAVLKEVSVRLKALAGPQDTVGRLADDTFAVVQPAGDQPEAVEQLCRCILSKIRAPFVIGRQTISITASIGCAIAKPGETRVQSLLRNSDTAMFRAAESGGDTYRIHEAEMTEAIAARVAMDRDLRHAIETDALDTRFQPLISAASRQICGFEAMVRWPRPGHGMVYPGEYLAFAEDTGLVVPLGDLTLNAACRAAASWPGLSVAVNLSPKHLLHDSLLDSIVRALGDYSLPARLLELEITEEPLLIAEDTALFRLDAFRELGVRLVIDKFGSGTSSLRHLRKFRFDKLKLDRSIVIGIDRDEHARNLSQALLGLAEALELQTAAEGVVSENQAEFLISRGCRQLQGKFFGKALPLERTFALIRGTGAAHVTSRIETGL